MEGSARDSDRDPSPLSDAPDEQGAEETNRRQSRRVRRKPELYSSQTFTSSSTKRKRTGSRAGDDESGASDTGAANSEESGDEDQEAEESSEEGPDEEEMKRRRKLTKKASKKTVKDGVKKAPSKAKRAAKKPKMANSIEAELAFRPLLNGGKKAPSRPRKPRVRPSGFAGEEGLYAEVFARGHTTDAVAAEWLTKYEQHNIDAMCDLVNFVLRCSGTVLKVDEHDIEDVDNVAGRLNDLQEEYQAQSITEYPIISKSKKFRGFQSVLTGFFDSLVRTIHSSSVLYTDNALMENIQAWITSMSSAPIRPFRHTATTISLAIATSMCHIAKQVSTTLSNTRKQLETEKKKKTTNKGRIGALQTKIKENEQKLETIDGFLHDSFDTVFVHRYRDVDPKIRAECITALGVWIATYRQVFFEGQYLRYLGWVLSDTVSHTRSVVVHQLYRLFQNKDNIPGLKAFTERFRPRLVEMAVRDAETSVRAVAVELSDLVRDAGLLEPDDIDSVGRLVLDSEARVRKAAGKFFVANIQDVYDAQTEGLEDELNESFADEDDDEDFKSPKKSWIKYKCLVDMLQAYNEQQSELAEDQDISTRKNLFASHLESRFALATESIFSHFPELSQWESLAGYLLYDHSQISESEGEDASNIIKQLFKLDEGQEAILLEVLSAAVKLHIQEVSKSDTDKKGRRTKQLVEMMEAKQETIAHDLAQIIPQLLNKFGAVPEAASAVLKLEHLVNLDLIQDLQKDAASYAEILNNINKQFLTHSDRVVLAEATAAFLHARTSDELKEAMENKVQELWDDTLDSLRSVVANKHVQENGTLPLSTLTSLSHTVMRISNLVSISDCTSILESSAENTRKKTLETQPLVDVLLSLTKRALRENSSDEEVISLERELLTSTFKTLLVYFMWKVQLLRAGVSRKSPLAGEFFEALSERRESFLATLTAIMQQGKGISHTRIAAATTLLDLQTAFGTLRYSASTKTTNPDDETVAQIVELVQDIPPNTSSLIFHIHDSVLKAYAKKIHHSVEVLSDDEAPLDSQSDIGDSSDEEMEDDEDAVQSSARRMRSQLLSEQELCQYTGKIVLAIIGHVLDSSGPQAGKFKEKLLRNKSRLGHNYKAILAYLDQNKTASSHNASKPNANATSQRSNGNFGSMRNGNVKSMEMVVEDDEEEEDGDDLRAREATENDIDLAAEGRGDSPLTPVGDDMISD
ncbi:cohesin complex subunit [Ophidiomyces ophidiicola]|nr:cohesin complex subunit [Ophidiomyces ophidiicola]